MATIDTHKTRIIKRILEIPNDELLISIDTFIDSFTPTSELVPTTTDQKKAIYKGIEDFKNGFIYTQEQVDKMDSEWLK